MSWRERLWGTCLPLFISLPLAAQSPCLDGLAAGMYPCENVDLIAHAAAADLGAAPQIEYNDIWGWTDPLDGGEYVLLGREDGTSFIEITDPLNPVNLGFLPTHTNSSIWRDIKVQGNYAYIVAEATGHGMQVFDLTRLRNVSNPPELFTADAHYGNFGNAHNVVINEEVARVYAVGSNTFSGGLHIVDVSNPLNPVIMGDFANDGYTHDAQVVTYDGPDAPYQGRQIAFCCNENTLTIVDVDNPLNCTQLGRVGYASVAYSHQGWLTEDHRYFLLGDELDEVNFGTNTRTVVWDVQDLNNPVVIGEFFSSVQAIDHNLYTKGNLVYQSNYRAGLRILDLEDAANGNLTEVAWFDLFPSSNSAQFNGSWSNYPYFESGIIAVSHIEEGLFLLQPNLFRTELLSSPVCEADGAEIGLTVLSGFGGPVNFSVSNGLPSEASAVFSENGVGSGTYFLNITGLTATSQPITLTVTATGATDTFSNEVTFSVIDCTSIIEGCTDPAATNFDPAADVDDGSCDFPCEAVTLTILTDCWGEEVSWQLTDDSGDILASVAENTYGNQLVYEWSGCLPAGCYTFSIFDGFGDGMSGSQYQSCNADGNYFMTDESGNILFEMTEADYGFGTSEAFCIEFPSCLGDFDNDGLRTVADILILLADFGCQSDCVADLDGNGVVTTEDMLIMLSLFGVPCP